jgi:hypothetical protein
MMKKLFAILGLISLLVVADAMAADQFYIKNTYVQTITVSSNITAALLTPTNAVGNLLLITAVTTNSLSPGIFVYDAAQPTNATTHLVGVIRTQSSSSESDPWTWPSQGGGHGTPDISNTATNLYVYSPSAATGTVTVITQYGSAEGVMPK